MFEKLESDSIDRFKTIFDNTCKAYTSKNASWSTSLGSVGLKSCRRVVHEIYQDFNALRTSTVLVDVMERREERTMTKNKATKMYICLVEEMVQRVQDLVAVWRKISGDSNHQWFKILCSVMKTFYPIMKKHDIESTKQWMASISREIVDVCRERIVIHLKHLDVKNIKKDFRMMKNSSVKLNLKCLKLIEECLSGCARDKLNEIVASFEKETDATTSVCNGTETVVVGGGTAHHHQHHQEHYYVDPLQAAVKQLGAWRVFERELLEVVHVVGDDRKEEVNRFRTRILLVVSKGSLSLAEKVVLRYESMLNEKLRRGKSGVGVENIMGEILMDIVCLKNDLMQHGVRGVDSIVDRLLNTVGLVDGSKVKRELNGDRKLRMLLLALLPSDTDTEIY